MKKDRDLLHARSGKGFTLIELLITLGVMTMLVAMGGPELIKYVKKQQVKADIERLSSAVRLARSEAMKRSGVVTVCPLQSESAATPACATNATTASWSNGWMIFIANGPVGTFSPGDTVLKVEQGTRSGKITSSAVVSNISFESLGVSTAAAGTFLIGESGSPQCKRLILSRQGRARTNDCSEPET